MALFCINPIPPNPTSVLKRLSSDIIFTSEAIQPLHYLKYLYCINDLNDRDFKKFLLTSVGPILANSKLPTYIRTLMEDDTKVSINLEPFSIPIYILFTNGDEKILSKNDMKAMMAFYKLTRFDLNHVPCFSRAPMLHHNELVLMDEALQIWFNQLQI